MAETKAARDKILQFLEKEERSIASLAVMFDVTKMYMWEVLNGKKTGPKANELILTIIDTFKIK
jgi:hypothetical protein